MFWFSVAVAVVEVLKLEQIERSVAMNPYGQSQVNPHSNNRANYE